MLTQEINGALAGYRGFLGAWPCDMVPNIGPKQGVVVNTDTSNKEGRTGFLYTDRNMDP